MTRPAGPRAVREAPAPIRLSADEIAWVRSMVIYEDDDLLALNKPSGLSSQGGRGQVHTLDELLWAFAKPGKARPRLIHRLDRDTSGVILTAKTKPAASALGKAMMARRFGKTYLAVVTPGAPEPPEGLIDLPMRREEIGREAYMRICSPEAEGAETAESRYRTLSVGAEAALLELSPKTGRMHQLRVHLGAIGRPIAGDVRYGGALSLGGRPASRLMLHAAALDVPLPAGERRRITAPPPADMSEFCAALGLTLPERRGPAEQR
ncbi:MAG: RluA family pseudouridine synthase [Phenylobacterium sp.]|uniref:RluA family pseudouridine synthase n=1 Tax=Phenylobacterium sp. TaxID=1871053 RepID=UPI00272281CB|nr:RluA family pseudouridine synthase [Phenylobacterium sp.]MDO8902746.1 RluA family pseudouridine synthase [Phenylobacterium sp.]MDP2214589.1 RluA family pseudouridine synthase [Phenylobacterium sp.]